MYAFKGDRIHVQGQGDAVVISSDYTDGRPPFWVRYDSGQQDLLYPDSSADIEHAGPAYPLEDEPRLVVAAHDVCAL